MVHLNDGLFLENRTFHGSQFRLINYGDSGSRRNPLERLSLSNVRLSPRLTINIDGFRTSVNPNLCRSWGKIFFSHVVLWHRIAKRVQLHTKHVQTSHRILPTGLRNNSTLRGGVILEEKTRTGVDVVA